jgi:hypothetical protein
VNPQIPCAQQELTFDQTARVDARSFRLPIPLALATLILLNLVCFSNSFSVRFLSDDFLHLSMVHKAFHGHPELLSVGINSVWQDNGYQLFVRPLIELSLAADYLFWKANPFGYHLTNFITHTLCTFCLYAISSILLKRVDRIQASWAAFIAAALFASYPLHGEAVTWIICRVDGLCGLFYLLSIFFYLKHCDCKKAGYIASSLGTFGAALLCKEMSASLPLVIGLHQLVLNSDAGSRLEARLKRALYVVTPYLAVFAVYLVIRVATLGTLVGGYTSSLGETFYATFWTRLLSVGTLWTFVFPLNIEVVPVTGKLSHALHYLYLLAGLALIMRSIFLPWQRECAKLLVFLSATTVVTLLPALQVFAISSALGGSRFAYIPSAPFCILGALIFMPVERSSNKTGRLLSAALVFLMAAICGCFALLTIRNNQAILSASDATTAIQKAIVLAADHKLPGKKMVVINPPRDVLGVPMFVAFEVFRKSLAPPFTHHDVSSEVVSLDQNYFCSSDLLNVGRLKELASSGDFNFYFWEPQAMTLRPVSESSLAKWCSAGAPDTKPIPTCVGHRVFLDKSQTTDRFIFQCQPSAQLRRFNFVDVRLSGKQMPSLPISICPERIALSWDSAYLPHFARVDAPYFEIAGDSTAHTYRFPVGERKSWYLAENAGKLYVDLPCGKFKSYDVSVSLVDGSNLIPRLIARGSTVNLPDGNHLFPGDSGCLSYDASQAPGCKGAVLEISQPAYKFEDKTGTFRDQQFSSQAARRITLKEPRGEINLQAREFQASKLFQARIFAVASNGKPIGYSSDPLLFSFDSKINSCR